MSSTPRMITMAVDNVHASISSDLCGEEGNLGCVREILRSRRRAGRRDIGPPGDGQ